MSDAKPGKALSAAAAEKRRLRWLGRWLLKLVGWFFALSLVVVLIGTVVAWFAWRNLTGLANMAAARFVAPCRVELGKVDVTRRGEVHVETVRLRPPPELADEKDSPWVHLDGLDLTYDLDELRNERRFRTVTLRKPVIRIDDASLDLLAGGKDSSRGEQAKAATPDLAFLGRLAERIEVADGVLEIDTSRAPRLEARWDLSVPPIDFADDEWLNREPLGFRLTDVEIGRNGELGTIESVGLRARVRSDLSGVEIGELSVERPELAISPAWLPKPETGESETGETAAGAGSSSPPATESARAPFEVLLGALRLNDARISVSGFDSAEKGLVIPDVAFRSSVDWRDLRITGGAITSSDPLELALADLVVDGQAQPASGETPAARFERVVVRFAPGELLRKGRLESVELQSPRLHLTPTSTERFVGKAEEASAAKPSPDPAESERGDEGPAWEIGRLAIHDGEWHASGWSWDDREIPAVDFHWDMELADLSPRSLAREGTVPDSEPGQQVAVTDFRVHALAGEPDLPSSQPEPPAILALEKMNLTFGWGELLRGRRIDSLEIERPLLDFTDERLPAWVIDFTNEMSGEKSSQEPETAEETVAPTETGALFTAGKLEIEDGVLRLDTEAFGGRLPKLQGRFGVANLDEPEAEQAATYRLQLGELRVRSQQGEAMPGSADEEERAEGAARTEVLGGLFPEDPDPSDSEGTEASALAGRTGAIRERDVAFVRELKIDFTAEGLQRDRRVERIEVKGGEFQVGEGLQQMVGGDPKNAENAREQTEAKEEVDGDAQAAAGMDRTGEWTVGEFVVTESQVRFESLIPQIEGLEFAIETRLQEIPLSQGGLLAQDRTQKVELAGIEIRDPYDSFITVAFLPTIFVEFSFAGLVNQRIDKIDLISPSIYVGQGLFWWIDYQRNYRKQNEGAGFGVEGATNAVADTEVEEPGVDWEISRINAHFGKIVIAPTGRPIGVVPFPFKASTNMEDGEIELKLEIPREQQYVYRFPDLSLDLFGLKGDVQFNVPIRQEDNNLVQTFELERAIWKQYQVEDLYLTVTYDTNGIYGRFGGEAYDGYAEGQFNVYLDDVGRWDAWLAGSTFDMGSITEVVAPDNFLMEGEVNAKLVSEGKGLLFGETWGEIETLTPGRIDFTKLNEVIQDLPDDWSQLKQSVTKLSLETLKQFEYETGRGDLYFLNQDGWLRLNLEGETGSRRLELYAHDWRGESEVGQNSNGAATGRSAPPEPAASVEGGEADPPGPKRERRRAGPRGR